MLNAPQKTWLITGADKGLGAAAAEAALAQGDNVVVTVLAADGGHPLSSEFPDRFRSIHLDARDTARIGAVAAEAELAFGSIDVLINNAGYGLIAIAEATTADKYRPLFEVNFFSLTEMTRAVLPVMRRQRSGHIINLSSYAGFCATPGFSFYSASKFAVEGYSESLANEVAEMGISVTIIEPGAFRSDFAGSSLDQQIDAFDGDYVSTAKKVEEYSSIRHGKQPNDPKKFGPALCRLVGLEKPPLRLPLGADALDAILKELDVVRDELERYRDLARSTHFDD